MYSKLNRSGQGQGQGQRNHPTSRVAPVPINQHDRGSLSHNPSRVPRSNPNPMSAPVFPGWGTISQPAPQQLQFIRRGNDRQGSYQGPANNQVHAVYQSHGQPDIGRYNDNSQMTRQPQPQRPTGHQNGGPSVYPQMGGTAYPQMVEPFAYPQNSGPSDYPHNVGPSSGNVPMAASCYPQAPYLGGSGQRVDYRTNFEGQSYPDQVPIYPQQEEEENETEDGHRYSLPTIHKNEYTDDGVLLFLEKPRQKDEIRKAAKEAKKERRRQRRQEQTWNKCHPHDHGAVPMYQATPWTPTPSHAYPQPNFGYYPGFDQGQAYPQQPIPQYPPNPQGQHWGNPNFGINQQMGGDTRVHWSGRVPKNGDLGTTPTHLPTPYFGPPECFEKVEQLREYRPLVKTLLAVIEGSGTLEFGNEKEELELILMNMDIDSDTSIGEDALGYYLRKAQEYKTWAGNNPKIKKLLKDEPIRA